MFYFYGIMKRKFLLALIILLIFASNSYADFGGFSGRSSSSRSSRHYREARRHSKAKSFILGSIFFIVVFSGKYFWNLRKPGIKKAWDGRKSNSMKKYLELYPNFDENKFKDFISDLYYKMQETWQAKDISPIKDFMTGELISGSKDKEILMIYEIEFSRVSNSNWQVCNMEGKKQ